MTAVATPLRSLQLPMISLKTPVFLISLAWTNLNPTTDALYIRNHTTVTTYIGISRYDSRSNPSPFPPAAHNTITEISRLLALAWTNLDPLSYRSGITCLFHTEAFCATMADQAPAVSHLVMTTGPGGWSSGQNCTCQCRPQAD